MLRPTLVLLIALTDAQGATPNLAIRRRQPPAAAAALITPAQQEVFLCNDRFAGYKFPDMSNHDGVDTVTKWRLPRAGIDAL